MSNPAAGGAAKKLPGFGLVQCMKPLGETSEMSRPAHRISPHNDDSYFGIRFLGFELRKNYLFYASKFGPLCRFRSLKKEKAPHELCYDD
jgi:hypothetical protein